MSGEIPAPLSFTRRTTEPFSPFADTRIRPPGSVYFAAFVRRFAITCARRSSSPSTKRAPPWDGDLEVVRALLEKRARHLDSLAQDLRDFDRLLLQLDFAPRDA